MSNKATSVFDLSESEDLAYNDSDISEPIDYTNLPVSPSYIDKFPAFERSTRNNQAFLIEMPPSISIESKTFDPQDKFLPNDIEEISKNNYKTNFVTARWMGDAQNQKSNARICKWSDGSMTLQIGNEHVPIGQRGSKYNPPVYHLIPDPNLVSEDPDHSALPFTSANIQAARLETAHTTIDERHKKAVDAFLAQKFN